MPLNRNQQRRARFSHLSGDPYTPSFDDPYSGGDGRICVFVPSAARETDERRALRSQEATVGFEPTNEGFADPCLTTWRRRREKLSCQLPVASLQLLRRSGSTGNWEPVTGNCAESGRWDSNPRPSPWQGDVLPLNHARVDERIPASPANVKRPAYKADTPAPPRSCSP